MKGRRWAIFLCGMVSVFSVVRAQQKDSTAGYVIRHESEMGKPAPGPHDGTGQTIGYGYFDDVSDFKIYFRKRVLHPGASIGRHTQQKDEVYYCESGSGKLTVNGKEFDFKPGDAVLTRTGSTHELHQSGDTDLVIFIVYEK